MLKYDKIYYKNEMIFMDTKEKKKYYLVLLSMFVAGGLNAYTFFHCGEVFATMHTGNLIYTFINLITLNFSAIPKYVFSILAFLVGILAQHLIVEKLKCGRKICYALLPVLYVAGFIISITWENFIVANVLFSFGMGIQFQMTRSINSFVIANTMCSGNMRSMMECLGQYITTKDKKYLMGIRIYSTLIGMFIVGLVLVTVALKYIFQVI